MSAKRRILSTTTPPGVIRIVRAIASMKVSSERYKTESRIALGYVNRMQILRGCVCVAKEKRKKNSGEASALLSNGSRIVSIGESIRAQVTRTRANSVPGLSDGRGLVWKPELRLGDRVRDVINEKLYAPSLEVPLN